MRSNDIIGILIIGLCFFASPVLPKNKVGKPKEPKIGVEIHPEGTKGGSMVYVPPGKFMMGCNEKLDENCEDDEKPYHEVYVDGFYIDKYEVTNRQYLECIKEKKCSENNKYDGFTEPDQPVVGVAPGQLVEYCSWAGKRLPTEAEWEKAARGTDGRTYPWGEGIDCKRANYKDCGHRKTVAVGSYPSGASPYGVMDMAGNADEMVVDWYDQKYYSNSPKMNPKREYHDSYLRIFRGGSWYDYAEALRASSRHGSPANGEDGVVGFRCAKSAE